MSKMSPARHAQGLAAYRSGKSILEVTNLLSEIEAMEPETPEEREELYNAGPSIAAGFADGLLSDIRIIAAATRRTGQTA